MAMDDDFRQRLEAVERLTRLFRTERMVYLTTTMISLLMLVGSALSLMVRNQAGTAELTMLFGSSGLITYTAGRLLYMWSEALKRLIPSDSAEKDAS
jgi:hypothetical protein